MSSIKVRNTKIFSEYEVPNRHIVSEGENVIKDLVKKQLNKTVNLQEELLKNEKFSPATELVNETALLSGKNSLETFKERAEYVNNLEILKSSGLSNEEIILYYDYQKGEDYLFFMHKNICQSILKEKLNVILQKIKQKTEHCNNNRRNENISRHVKEIALSTKPNSIETKLYEFAVSSNSVINKKPPNHPINTLPQLENDLFGHLNNPYIPPLKKRRKKAKKYLDADNNTIITKSTVNFNNKTKWDLQEIPCELEKNNRIYSCTSNRKYTIKDNKIVSLESCEDSKEENLVIKGKPFVVGNKCNVNIQFDKMTENQIKTLPKFQNYERGTPTKVLFLKNLAKQIDEQDLINLFNSLDNEDNKITYRLLSGKMKGQAFVTFNSVEQATKALELVNGAIIKNKPIIIQYGKSA